MAKEFLTAIRMRHMRSLMPHRYLSIQPNGAFRPNTSCWFCKNPPEAIIHSLHRKRR